MASKMAAAQKIKQEKLNVRKDSKFDHKYYCYFFQYFLTYMNMAPSKGEINAKVNVISRSNTKKC